MGSITMDDIAQLQEVMIEFRAGKMFTEGKRVIPDTRKGLVRIGRGEEGLLHFQWIDRTLNVIEDDQIVFPDEAVFAKVNQSSDRVYLLKFNTDTRKFFFWMQEPRFDEDTQICNNVNYYINQPLVDLDTAEEVDASMPLQASEAFEEMAEDETSIRDRNLVGQNHATRAVNDLTSLSGPVQLEDLQRILSTIGSSDTAIDHDEGLGLSDILRPDYLIPLTKDLPLQERLASYLPEGPWSSDDIVCLLQSPQVRQQLDSFTYVLKTGQIDLSQFGIRPNKYRFTVLSFLEALEDSVSESLEGNTDEPQHDDSSSGLSKMYPENDPMDQDK